MSYGRTPSHWLESIVEQIIDKHEQAISTKMRETLQQDPKLVKRLVPNFPMGCRRLGPAEGFLEAMLEPNVTLAEGGVKEFTPKGILTDDGFEHEVDIIICATGFDTSFRPYFPIIGRNGKSLSEHWGTEPEAYFAMAAAGYPNFMRKSFSTSSDEFTWRHLSRDVLNAFPSRLTMTLSRILRPELSSWSWFLCDRPRSCAELYLQDDS
jgi:cation diffusion facilitator CzcD-associated flavoprotein CzcO